MLSSPRHTEVENLATPLSGVAVITEVPRQRYHAGLVRVEIVVIVRHARRAVPQSAEKRCVRGIAV